MTNEMSVSRSFEGISEEAVTNIFKNDVQSVLSNFEGDAKRNFFVRYSVNAYSEDEGVVQVNTIDVGEI